MLLTWLSMRTTAHSQKRHLLLFAGYIGLTLENSKVKRLSPRTEQGLSTGGSVNEYITVSVCT